jgi:hypothetical protein
MSKSSSHNGSAGLAPALAPNVPVWEGLERSRWVEERWYWTHCGHSEAVLPGS